MIPQFISLAVAVLYIFGMVKVMGWVNARVRKKK